MKQRNLTLAVLIALALCTVAAWAQAPQMPSFSADMKMTGHKGQDTTGKMFFSGESRHIRMEMLSHGHNAVIIVDSSNPNNPKSMMVMPEQKMYMEMSGAGPMHQRTPEVRAYDPNNPCAGMEGTTCKKVGVETVNGYASDKWEFTGKDNQTVWIAQQLHFPVRSVQQDGTTVDFTNIKPGPQDASLFQAPAGYRKFDMGAMMGGHKPEDQ